MQGRRRRRRAGTVVGIIVDHSSTLSSHGRTPETDDTPATRLGPLQRDNPEV
jgi:hypothetical protein